MAIPQFIAIAAKSLYRDLQGECLGRRRERFRTRFHPSPWTGFQPALNAVLDEWTVRSIVDAPCGDFNWMLHVLAGRDVVYTGIDIVHELIADNVRLHATPHRRFVCADMTRAPLPQADLLICRDGLVHLSFTDARAAIRNFRRSGSRYLLATTFVDRASNTDIHTGAWRPLNTQAPPFGFPGPLALIDERCSHTEGIYRDKRLALWEIATLVT